jgi:hypothetical protein
MAQWISLTLSLSKNHFFKLGNGILSTDHYRLDIMEFLLLDYIAYLLAIIVLVLIVCLLVFFVWE